MSPPRKPRSPGQRQFRGANPMGSPAEWARVAQDPQVQRALADPQIAQALYHSFRGSGGNVPNMPSAGSPVGMQSGGGIPTAEDLNRLSQIRGGDIDPYDRNQLEELAEESRPVRFQTGGYSMTDLQAKLRQAQADEAAARQKGDGQAVQKAEDEQAEINSDIARATQAQAQPGSPVSLGGNLGQVSGTTMSGLKSLGQQGPPTVGNMAANILTGGLLGGAGTGSAGGALIGAATAGLLNYFIRKQGAAARQKRQQQQNQSSGSGGSDSSPSQQPGQQSSGTGGTSGAGTGLPQTNVAPPPANSPGLIMGTSSAGNVRSYDQGKTWLKDDDKPFTPDAANPVVNQWPVKTFDQQSTAPTADTGALDEQALTDSMDTGLARGGPVPHGGLMAHHMPIPILHTTIVIAAKPKKGAKEEKPTKRSMGGDIPQSQRRPRKPHAIPPIAGPESSGARLPHGRVQVPRGSGAAIRGKRFGGVY